MMGIPIEEPSYCYGDNMSVLYNTSNPESTLKKKSNLIAYHYVRESVAMDESKTGFVGKKDNLADLMTKPLPHGQRRKDIVDKMMWDIYQKKPITPSTAE